MDYTKLVTYLKADPVILEMVGDRVYPGYLPQDMVLPALVWNHISSEPSIRAHDKVMLNIDRVQFTIWSTSYIGGHGLATRLRQMFDGFQGTIGQTLIIEEAQAESINMYFDPDGNTPGWTVDITFLYKEL